MVSPRLYASLVLVVAIAATLSRLLGARSYAQAAVRRMQDARQRTLSTLAGVLALLAAFFLALMAPRQVYPVLFWMGAAVAFLSGVQMLVSLVLRTPGQFLWLSRVIGILFAVFTVILYVALFR